MRCNVAVFGLVCFILQSGAVTAQSGPNREAVQKQIETNERAIIEAIFKNDAKTFHSHVVGDSLIVGGEGVIKGGRIRSDDETDVRRVQIQQGANVRHNVLLVQ